MKNDDRQQGWRWTLIELSRARIDLNHGTSSGAVSVAPFDSNLIADFWPDFVGVLAIVQSISATFAKPGIQVVSQFGLQILILTQIMAGSDVFNLQVSSAIFSPLLSRLFTSGLGLGLC